jgi:hypothetical protein
MRQRKRTPVYELRRVAANEELQTVHDSLEEALNFEAVEAEFDASSLTPEQRRASFGLIDNTTNEEDNEDF